MLAFLHQLNFPHFFLEFVYKNPFSQRFSREMKDRRLNYMLMMMTRGKRVDVRYIPASYICYIVIPSHGTSVYYCWVPFQQHLRSAR